MWVTGFGFKSPQIGPKENLTINGPATQEKRKKKKLHLKLRKEIMIALPMMTLFLHAERNKEAMTVFRGSLEKYDP